MSADSRPLADVLRDDLTTAMKARDELRTATLRMALTAMQTEAVAGKTAVTLTDEQVLGVLTREVKKRREAAEAFEGANRSELAARERAEGEVLAGYLPAQLTDDELSAIVSDVLAESGASGPGAMGPVMKSATARVAGRAEGGRVAAEVRRQLGS